MNCGIEEGRTSLCFTVFPSESSVKNNIEFLLNGLQKK